jgi:hypothetical protein
MPHWQPVTTRDAQSAAAGMAASVDRLAENNEW